MPFSRGGRLEEYLGKRMDISRAFSLLEYTKGSGYAEVFKEIKYRDNAELALFMGKLMGYKLLSLGWPRGLTFVPIPMTRWKKLRRGYNQAELLAKGVAQVMGGKLELNLLTKSSNTVSQTLMGRWERWLNSKGIYMVKEGADLEQKLVLVDDIVTTGATIDSCRMMLQRHYDVKVWVVSLGFTP
jgi:ComF family protein